jgi:hypothetical protein
MSTFYDVIALGRYSLLAGTAATATVPDGAVVVAWSCSVASGGAAGTVTITPGGAGQVASALPAVTVPPGRGVSDDQVLGRLGPGTSFVFAGTESYLVTLAYPAGAAS